MSSNSPNTVGHAPPRLVPAVLRSFTAVAASVAVFAAGLTPAAGWQDPTPFFPEVRLNGTEMTDLRQRAVIVKLLPSAATPDLIVFAAAAIDVTPERFVQAMRHGAALWRGSNVPRTGSFSQPPRAEDLQAMQLPAGDLDALHDCDPGDCDVKLSAAEMRRLRTTVDRNRGDLSAAQAHFRALMLERLRDYVRGGLAALAPLASKERSVDLQRAFSAVIPRKPSAHGSSLLEYLDRYPHLPLPDGAVEQLYWLETANLPKPTTQAWHMLILQNEAGGSLEVVVVSRQIFATHYLNASLSMTVLVRANSGHRFLYYLNHSSIDDIEGFLPAVQWFFIRRRVQHSAHQAYEHLIRRIENYQER